MIISVHANFKRLLHTLGDIPDEGFSDAHRLEMVAIIKERMQNKKRRSVEVSPERVHLDMA